MGEEPDCHLSTSSISLAPRILQFSDAVSSSLILPVCEEETEGLHRDSWADLLWCLNREGEAFRGTSFCFAPRKLQHFRRLLLSEPKIPVPHTTHLRQMLINCLEVKNSNFGNFSYKSFAMQQRYMHTVPGHSCLI